ncbi:transcriptional regulator [Saccharomycopsis crataegensis]|uniref:Transcriptional regulator n=1 Tax=Saccharomycopsis crataegensis TaxID=43959 RepID=A0AAV5QPY5_9ASCO|nr:transcriptional regulator [Saccharomycopsis crataegensis]
MNNDQSSNQISPSKYKYHVEIQQMMFVSGETHDPPFETTALIEDIVRGQVVEILLQATRTAAMRGSKSIASEDMIFMIRHDKAKVNRLRTYLSWKDVRKNAKDQDGGGSVDNNDFLEDSAAAAGGMGDGSKNSGSNILKYKKSKLRLPWELAFLFSEQALETNDDVDEDDEEEREAMMMSLKRLKNADDRTKGMTREEYVHFSECRQASFTFRKGKRFKEWCGTSYIMESKPSDDVIDILGFLTFEMVCSLTEEALQVKQQETANSGKKMDGLSTSEGRKSKHRYLFDGPGESVKPLQSYHMEEAWRRLQIQNFKSRAMLNFRGGRLHSRMQII